jgi:hypothetical protein
MRTLFELENREKCLAVSLNDFGKFVIHQRASGSMRSESSVTLLDAEEVAWLARALVLAVAAHAEEK